jgi:acetylornithine deacetylase/succinyl-diaminopimelate desuccinylase-like protein/CubicO group peptidase (beta-lactamase class C family)
MRWARIGAALALGVSAVAAAPPADPSRVRDQVRTWRRAHEAAILREFGELLALPNLASDAVNIRRNADRIVAMLRQRGLSARLLDGRGGPPPVYGELTVPGARRTVLVYAHYDGQPVDANAWASPPWTPVLRDRPVEEGGREVPLESLPSAVPGEWRLYARSAGDDKAPIIGVLAALDALKATGRAPTVNLKLFFEGEEEAGSPHMAEVLDANRETLRADLWLLCDGPVHQSRRMQVFFGARGETDVEITVYGPLRALHSGHYGNWAPNPALLLAHLVAGLRDEDGRVLVPGFYDDVRPPTEAETQAAAAVPDVEGALRHDMALATTEAGGARLPERILLPALNVRGLTSGHVGASATNSIPTEAQASIDIRLVPDQTPEKVRSGLEAHLRARGYTVVHEVPDVETRRTQPRIVRLVWGAGYPGARTSMDLPVSRAVVRVLEEALGAPVVRMPTLGGSVPMYLFQQKTGSTIIGLPIANHDDNQHAANENLRLQNLWDGIEAYAAILTDLDTAWEESPRPVAERVDRVRNGLLLPVVIRGQPLSPMKLADRMTRYHVPGVSIAVIHDGAIEWTRGFGTMGVNGSPVTPDTLFQAGSISKPVAAMAALRLVQEGKLDLDADANRYLKSWKVPATELTEKKKVTIRGLLSHTAGLTIHGFPGYAAGQPIPTVAQVLDGKEPANTKPVRVDVLPGSQYRYSGGGYTVLQQLLADVTGKPFPRFMEEMVLQPLQMAHSTYEQPLPTSRANQAATPYDNKGEPVPRGPHTYPEMAAAGLWSTSPDLARFAIGLQNALAGKSRLLSEATAREMVTPLLDGYGLGVGVQGSGPTLRFSHGGSDEGFESFFVAYAGTGNGAVVMTNGQQGSPLAMEIVRAIAREYGWPDLQPRERTIASVDPAVYDTYVGTYEIAPGDTFELSRSGGKLLVDSPGTGKSEVYPESPVRFFVLGLDVQLEFSLDEAGAATGVKLHGDGWDLSARKVK